MRPTATDEVAVLGCGAFVSGFTGLPGFARGEPTADRESPRAALVPLRQRRRASLLSKAFADAYGEVLETRSEGADEAQRLRLTRVLFDKDVLYSFLPQRGGFALIDGVVLMDMEQDLIVGFKDVRHDEWWSEDHIPETPIFPGALMVEASAQLGTFHFYHRIPEQQGAFIGFTGIDKTRFRSSVAPGCRLYLVAKVHRMRTNLFTYVVQGYTERDGVLDERMVFQTEVTGMVLVPATERVGAG